jgi:hypothetical protein
MWTSGKVVDFNYENFIIESDDEVFILGYNTEAKQYSVLGLLEDNDGEIYCYFVKQHNQSFYEDIIKKDEEIWLKNDISMGMWHSNEFNKSEMPIGIEHIINSGEPIKLVSKTSGGFMVPDDYGTKGITFNQLVVLSKPKTKNLKSILEDKLNKAIDSEDYEEAIKLRDEINNL